MKPPAVTSALFVLLLLAATRVGGAEPPGPAATPAYPLTAFTAIGSSFAQHTHLGDLGWSEEQFAAFLDGVRATYRGKPQPLDDLARQLSAEMARRVQEMEMGKSPAPPTQPAGLEQFMKDIRKRYSLQQTDSGLCFSFKVSGSGVRPTQQDTVVVSVTCIAANGTTKLPQLGVERARVKMSTLLPGLLEGIQMMTLDSKAVFLLPPALSFGDGEWPQGVERGMPLIFLVELHEVVSGESPP